jgi:phenylpropionate dioxygenase-like ring-hydroxylating dioxygenase large terminal subunit
MLDLTDKASRTQSDKDQSADFWYPVATSDELGSAPLAVTLLGVRVVLYRSSDGSPVALRDLCLHRGTPLSLGRTDGDMIVCGYHGWAYGTDGICVRIPQRPATTIPTKARTDAFHAREAYGVIFVCLGDPLLPITPYPEYADDDYGTVFVGTKQWNANAVRIVENFFDVAHLAWVHPGSLGDPRRPEVEVGTIQYFESGFEFMATSPIPTSGGGWINETLNYRLLLPFWFTAIHIEGHTPTGVDKSAASAEPSHAGRRYRVDIAVCPIEDRRSRFYTWISRNYSTDSLDDAVEFQRSIAEQDRPIVEAQRPEELPIDLSEEMHIRNVDAPAVEFRRLLRRVGLLAGTA